MNMLIIMLHKYIFLCTLSVMDKDSVLLELRHVLDKAGISVTAAAINHLEVTPQYLYRVFGGALPPSKKLVRRMEKLISTLKASGLIAS